MKVFSYLFLSVLGILAAAGRSFAYVPSSYFIAQSWVDTHLKNKQQSYRITSQIDLGGSNPQEPSLSFKETLIFHPRSETLKVWVTHESGQLLYYRESKVKLLELPRLLVFAGDTKSLIEGFNTGEIPVLDEEKHLGFSNDAERLKGDQVALKRNGGQVAWVIAQKTKRPLSPSQPQVWFEKDTFLPIKLVFKESLNQKTYEIRYEFEESSSQKGFTYPKTISILNSDSTPVFRSKLLEVIKGSEGSDWGMPYPKAQGLSSFADSSPAGLKALLKFYDELFR